MRKTAISMMVASVVGLFGIGIFVANTFAEENTENESNAPATSMTLMPVSTTLSLSSDSTYDGTMTVTNDGDTDMKVQVYATPYFYVYSENDDSYKLGFNTENNYTQIARWITVKDSSGKYVEKPTFTIKPKESLGVEYRVQTPKSIPAGGQYAVLFAQTVSGNVNTSGVRTEASAGMVIYGRSTEGETKTEAEFSDLEIGQGAKFNKSADDTQSDTNASEETPNNSFYGYAKIKNTGNVDFFAKGELKVQPIFGFSAYETPQDGGTISVIPESERVVQDQWKDTPSFGLYKVTWTVKADLGGGETKTESIERVILLLSPLSIIITIIVLTFIIVLVIILIRKRKARRSRLAV